MFSMSRWRVVAEAVARRPGGVVCVVAVLAAAVACLVGGEFWWALGGAVRGCLGGCDE